MPNMQHPHSGYSEHSPAHTPTDHAPLDREAQTQKGAIVLVIAGGDAAQRPRPLQENPIRVLIWIKYWLESSASTAACRCGYLSRRRLVRTASHARLAHLH